MCLLNGKNKSLCTIQIAVIFRTNLNATLPILVAQFRNDTAYRKNYAPLLHIRSTHPIALPSALPNVLPSLQRTFTRRTSRQCLGNLRAFNQFHYNKFIIYSLYHTCLDKLREWVLHSKRKQTYMSKNKRLLSLTERIHSIINIISMW